MNLVREEDAASPLAQSDGFASSLGHSPESLPASLPPFSVGTWTM